MDVSSIEKTSEEIKEYNKKVKQLLKGKNTSFVRIVLNSLLSNLENDSVYH